MGERPSKEQVDRALRANELRKPHRQADRDILAAEVIALREELDLSERDRANVRASVAHACAEADKRVDAARAENAKLREELAQAKALAPFGPGFGAELAQAQAALNETLGRIPKVTRIEPSEPSPLPGWPIEKVTRAELAKRYPASDPTVYRTSGTDVLVKASDVAALVKAARAVVTEGDAFGGAQYDVSDTIAYVDNDALKELRDTLKAFEKD